MTVDEQKLNRDTEISHRASLYGRMFALLRAGAPEEQLDAILVEIATCEAEIRRLSDEVNDRIWYQNYNKILDGYGAAVTLLQADAGQREKNHADLMSLLEETVRGLKKLVARVTKIDARDTRQYRLTLKNQEQLQAKIDALAAGFDQYKAGSRREQVDTIVQDVEDIKRRLAALEAGRG